MKRLMSLAALVVILTLALPVTAFAQGTQDGRVVLGGSFTLEAGETMDGDLAVLGGNVTLEETSVLEGSLLIMGGNAVVAARITGDVVVMGGNVDLLNPARVEGDIVSFGGNVDQAEQAVVEGDIVTEDGFDFPMAPRIIPSVPSVPQVPSIRATWAPVVKLLWFAFRTLMLAALAVLVVMFWPEPSGRTAEAIVSQPLATGGIGLLTFLVAPIILVMLLITILLSPISLLGAILLLVAAVYGWIAVGLEVGERLAKSVKWELHPAAAAGLGTLLLTFVVGGIGMVPCVGWVAPFIVASLGLGGVILTRFGSRRYEVGEPQAP